MGIEQLPAMSSIIVSALADLFEAFVTVEPDGIVS